MPLYRRVPKLKHFTLVNPKSFTVLNVSALTEISRLPPRRSSAW